MRQQFPDAAVLVCGQPGHYILEVSVWVVAIELGAGLAIPTVRRECEACASMLIRINPREADEPGGISLPLGALAALERMHAHF